MGARSQPSAGNPEPVASLLRRVPDIRAALAPVDGVVAAARARAIGFEPRRADALRIHVLRRSAGHHSIRPGTSHVWPSIDTSAGSRSASNARAGQAES